MSTVGASPADLLRRLMRLTPVNQRVLLHRARQQVRICMNDYLELDDTRAIVA